MSKNNQMQYQTKLHIYVQCVCQLFHNWGGTAPPLLKVGGGHAQLPLLP